VNATLIFYPVIALAAGALLLLAI